MHTFTYGAAGMALTKEFEGLRLEAYADCAGVWTIGYGHTGRDVSAGRRVTEAEAAELLTADLRDAIQCVNGALDEDIELAQNQFDALQFRLWVNVDRKPVPGLARRRAAEAALFRGRDGRTA